MVLPLKILKLAQEDGDHGILLKLVCLSTFTGLEEDVGFVNEH